MSSDIHTLVIVEDERETRERLSRVIEQCDFLRCIAACATFAEGKDIVERENPDIALLDIDLPDGSGLNLIELLAEKSPNSKAVVITVFEDDRHVMDAIASGADGYILKDDPSISIEQALKMILAGGAPISPTVARHILARFQEKERNFVASDHEEDRSHTLTERETEILVLVSDGFTDQEIADKVSISYHTVTTHVKNIYQKLSVHTRVEATREAIRFGIVAKHRE